MRYFAITLGLILGATFLCAEEQCQFSHAVQGGGVNINMPGSFSGPLQMIVSDTSMAVLPETILEEALEIQVLDMRGTEADLRVKASLMPLTNANVARPTTVEVVGVQGLDTDGVRYANIVGADSYTESPGFIEADPMVNRSFSVVLRITADAVSGQSALTGTYTGEFYLEVQ